MGNNGIFGIPFLDDFLSGLFGLGGQGGRPLGKNPMPDTVGSNMMDAAGIFGKLGTFLGSNMDPLVNLGLGYKALDQRGDMNKRAYKLAEHQQRGVDTDRAREWETWKIAQQDRDWMRAHGAAPLRQIGSDGQIRTTGESQGFHLPYNESVDRYNRIA